MTINNGLEEGAQNYFAAVIDAGGRSGNIVYKNQPDTVYDYSAYFQLDHSVYTLGSYASSPTLEQGEAVGTAQISVGGSETVDIQIRSRIPAGSAWLINEYAITASAGVDLRNAKFFQYLGADILSIGDDVLTVSGSVTTNSLNLKTIDPATRIQSAQVLHQPLVGCQATGFGAQYYSTLHNAIRSGSYDPPPEGLITLPAIQMPDIGDAYGPGDVTSASDKVSEHDAPESKSFYSQFLDFEEELLLC